MVVRNLYSIPVELGHKAGWDANPLQGTLTQYGQFRDAKLVSFFWTGEETPETQGEPANSTRKVETKIEPWR